uniref:Uncharacterized protein n=1 Tax=mine drainage metagenome TaxID=410659 RepID=E6PJX0_9ZZZZ
MAEGGAAVEASDAQAACLTAHWLQQACRRIIAQGTALDELEGLNAGLLQMQTSAVDAAHRGHAAQALPDLAWIRSNRRNSFSAMCAWARSPAAPPASAWACISCVWWAEKHGGGVGVQSAPGQGASFWLTLPLEPR